MADMSRELKAHASAVFTALVWGSTFVFSKVLLEDFSIFDILFYRFFIAYLVLTLIRPRPLPFGGQTAGDGELKKGRKEKWLSELAMALAGLFGVTLYFLSENAALLYTKTANVSIIVSLAPIFTALLTCIFLKSEKPRWNFYLGFLIAITGIAIISLDGSDGIAFRPEGDILAVLAAVCWAVYTVILRRAVPMEAGILRVTKRIMFYGLLTMIPCMAFFGLPLPVTQALSLKYLPALLFLGILASGVCYVTWNWSLGVLGAVKCSNYIYMIPVVTVAAAALMIQEPVTPAVLLGVLFAVAGLVLSEKKIKKPEKSAE